MGGSRYLEPPFLKRNMQLKKQIWKKYGKEKPCHVCGQDHETKLCVTRKGQKRRF